MSRPRDVQELTPAGWMLILWEWFWKGRMPLRDPGKWDLGPGHFFALVVKNWLKNWGFCWINVLIWGSVSDFEGCDWWNITRGVKTVSALQSLGLSLCCYCFHKGDNTTSFNIMEILWKWIKSFWGDWKQQWWMSWLWVPEKMKYCSFCAWLGLYEINRAWGCVVNYKKKYRTIALFSQIWSAVCTQWKWDLRKGGFFSMWERQIKVLQLSLILPVFQSLDL